MYQAKPKTDNNRVVNNKLARFEQLKATERLPSPTGVALVILQLVDNEQTPVAEICRVLQADPALTGRLLKLANSASAARTAQVTHVKDAVSVLGLRQVRNVALGFSLVSKHASGQCAGFAYHDFWSSSLATALAAQSVAAEVLPRSASDAFTCGLLLSIGQLALATVFPVEYDAVLAQARGQSLFDLHRLEQERFGIDHHELTLLMLQEWRLPPPCIEAVRTSRRPADNESKSAPLSRILHLAAHIGAISVAPLELQFALLPEMTRRGELAGIVGNRLFELGQAVMNAWQDWSGLLQIKTRPLPSFSSFGKWLADRAVVQADATPSDGSIRVLLAEPSAADNELLRRHLDALNSCVLTVATGREVLQHALEEQPQLLILAAELPEMDGLALCRTLRMAKSAHNMRIILIANQEADEQILRASAAGADDCLTRPLRPKVIEARLRSMERLIRFGAEVENERLANQRLAAELDLSNQKLHEEVRTDALTGLPNRRGGADRLDAAWDHDLSRVAVACLLLDIDHFKKVNDAYGHDAGDAVLRETAVVLRSALRQHDTICRWGGEEFLVIAIGADYLAARTVAERLRSAIQVRLMEHRGVTLHVTISIGIAVRTADMQSPSDLLKAADRALYAAKQAGRNRVCTPPEAAEDLPASHQGLRIVS